MLIHKVEKDFNFAQTVLIKFACFYTLFLNLPYKHGMTETENAINVVKTFLVEHPI